MTQPTAPHLRALLDRLTRLTAADAWNEQLTPTQLAVLDYLSRANRFSRAPSQVADYLAATRGTVSQTLKALEKKGFVSEQRSTEDKRRISYTLTEPGHAATMGHDGLDAAIAALSSAQVAALEDGLRAVLSESIRQRGARPFGLCETCAHHRTLPDAPPWCALLKVDLLAGEATQICHEHSPA